MKATTATTLVFSVFFLCFPVQPSAGRETIDFNFDWKFHLGDIESPQAPNIDWQPVRLPHDWSIIESYQQGDTAASTGFVPGGIGWYMKPFALPESDRGKEIWIEFDGIYCNSEVWINGHRLGFRPNGFSSFSYSLTEHVKFGGESNVIAVKVDHSAYANARWYTGSGIYRGVRLVKASAIHVPQWGVRVTTPEVDVEKGSATVEVETQLAGTVNDQTKITVDVVDPEGKVVSTSTEPVDELSKSRKKKALTPALSQREKEQNGLRDVPHRFMHRIVIKNAALWSVDDPNLYTVRVSIFHEQSLVDSVDTHFGIRIFEFDANDGFSLNGKSMKLKGVNLHHDAGAVGAAVPKAIWEYRVGKLNSIGVNSIRMSHNPHSVELMNVCDEMGMLVMDEFFDEWITPKATSIVYLGDSKGKGIPAAAGYSEHFEEWAERDLKDLIRRDFNHPSVIMWSIGNEIGWTFPKYSEVFKNLNPEYDNQEIDPPVFDPEKVKAAWDAAEGGEDELAKIASQLSKWVKEVDTTRPVTCGSVRPSIATVTGYSDAVDVMGFNYRANCYDTAHATYPDLKIVGSENWGAWSEWKAVKERDFVSGMFAWTGIAYMGEAGPWPRKGLEISFFDYAGFKTPRGHFFECLWKDAPKVYLVTTPADESEYSWTKDDGWKFEMQMTPPPVWSELRKWEWYHVNEHWNYSGGQPIVVQLYSNCDEVELLLNGQSLGKQKMADFPEDNIAKWRVPFEAGQLTAKGYRNGSIASEYSVSTSGDLASIELSNDKDQIHADQYDVAHVTVQLLDATGHPIHNREANITFEVTGSGRLLAVDNGWQKNVQPHYLPSVTTHNGRALALVQSTNASGPIRVIATIDGKISQAIELLAE